MDELLNLSWVVDELLNLSWVVLDVTLKTLIVESIYHIFLVEIFVSTFRQKLNSYCRTHLYGTVVISIGDY